MVYVIIPVYNRKGTTRKCLEYLRKQSFNDFMTLMIDDGSTDGTAAMISSDFPEVVLLQGNGELWWTKAVNMGIRNFMPHFKSGDYALFLNDDVDINKDYISNLVICASKNPGALIGSLLKDKHSGEISFPLQEKKIGLATPEAEAIFVESLVGRGMLVPVSVFEKVGLFDDALPHYSADTDFSLRAKNEGFDLIVSARAIIYYDMREKKIYYSSIVNPFEYLRWCFSIKNPFNIKSRYIMNKRHKKCWCLAFAYDILKIILRYPRNILIFICRPMFIRRQQRKHFSKG